MATGTRITFGSDGRFSYLCVDCCVSFSDKLSLEDHLLTGAHSWAVNIRTTPPADASKSASDPPPPPRREKRSSHLERGKDSRLFWCDRCNRTFLSEYKLTKHSKLHDEGLPVSKRLRPCRLDNCDRTFMNAYGLFCHQDDEHSLKTHSSCKKCKAKFVSRAECYIHERRFCKRRREKKETKEEKIKSWFCENCGKGFGERFILLLHLNRCSDNNEAQAKTACPICGVLVERNKLQAHRIKTHDLEKELTCDACDPPRKFRDVATIKAHNKIKHMKMHSHECPQCGMCFPILAMLKNHQGLSSISGCRKLIKTHLSIKLYDCSSTYLEKLLPLLVQTQSVNGDQEETSQVTDEENPDNSPSKEKRIRNQAVPVSEIRENIDFTKRQCVAKCKKCKHQYLTMESAITHVMILHVDNNKIKCEKCPKKFHDPNWLRAHCYKAHGDLLTKLELGDLRSRCTESTELAWPYIEQGSFPCFNCNYCDLAATRMPHLRSHLSFHKSQEWKCEICFRVEGPPFFLKQHLIYDHNIKNELIAECPFCEKPFDGQDKLKTHLSEEAMISYGGCRNVSKSNVVFRRRVKREVRKPKPNDAVSGVLVELGLYQLCKICNGLFLSKTIKRHLRKVHGIVVPMFSCRFCLDFKDHRSYHELLKHIKENHKTRTEGYHRRRTWFKGLDCDACVFSFKTVDNLFDHLIHDHEFLDIDIKRCGKCERPFVKVELWEEHERNCSDRVVQDSNVFDEAIENGEMENMNSENNSENSISLENDADFNRVNDDDDDDYQGNNYTDFDVDGGNDDNGDNDDYDDDDNIGAFSRLNEEPNTFFDLTEIKQENESILQHKIEPSDITNIFPFIDEQLDVKFVPNDPAFNFQFSFDPREKIDTRIKEEKRENRSIEAAEPEPELAFLGNELEDSAEEEEVKPAIASAPKSKRQKRNLAAAICNVCGKEFRNPHRSVSLKLHKERMHGNHGSFKCSICDKVYNSMEKARRHEKRHGLASSICNVCGKKVINMRQHQRTHTDVEDKVCNLCGCVYKGNFLLQAHKRRHHKEGRAKYGTPVGAMKRSSLGGNAGKTSCSICKISFENTTEYKIHRSKHHPKEGKQFQCTFGLCKKVFKAKKHMVEHVNWTHLQLKPYKCPTCSLSFPRPCDLKIHDEELHQNRKRYTCLVCNLYFSYRKTHMTKHITRVHKKEIVNEMTDMSFDPQGFVGPQENNHDPCKIGRRRKAQIHAILARYPQKMSPEALEKIYRMRVKPGHQISTFNDLN